MRPSCQKFEANLLHRLALQRCGQDDESKKEITIHDKRCPGHAVTVRQDEALEQLVVRLFLEAGVSSVSWAVHAEVPE